MKLVSVYEKYQQILNSGTEYSLEKPYNNKYNILLYAYKWQYLVFGCSVLVTELNVL